MDFIDNLRWRGILCDVTPGAEQLLQSGDMVTGYIGFDPSADSLGVGNLAQVMVLRHFQEAGHRPLVLIGGATGRVGDPSGKKDQRRRLTADEVKHNAERIKSQLSKFLRADGDNAVMFVDNSDWFNDIKFVDFADEIGQHFTVKNMLSKESVKGRMDNGMSFTEFCYQLMQGFDFLALWRNGVKVQLGGSDQWGNMTAGVELIRKKEGGEAHAITTRLVTKTDGTKFGKSEAGNVWLDPVKTSPFKFFQFWLNLSDEDALKMIRVFSTRGRDTIIQLAEAHQEKPNARILQNALAEEVTAMVHSDEVLARVKEMSATLFNQAGGLSELLSADLIGAFDSDVTFVIPKSKLSDGIVALIGEHTAIQPSKGEARKVLLNNGITINDIKMSIDSDLPEPLCGNLFVIRRGKKNHFLVKVDDNG